MQVNITLFLEKKKRVGIRAGAFIRINTIIIGFDRNSEMMDFLLKHIFLTINGMCIFMTK